MLVISRFFPSALFLCRDSSHPPSNKGKAHTRISINCETFNYKSI